MHAKGPGTDPGDGVIKKKEKKSRTCFWPVGGQRSRPHKDWRRGAEPPPHKDWRPAKPRHTKCCRIKGPPLQLHFRQNPTRSDSLLQSLDNDLSRGAHRLCTGALVRALPGAAANRRRRLSCRRPANAPRRRERRWQGFHPRRSATERL